MTIDPVHGHSYCQRCHRSEPVRPDTASRLLMHLEQLSTRERAAVPADTLLDPLGVPLAVIGSILALGLSGLVAFGFSDWERRLPNVSLSEGLVSSLVALVGWALGLLLLQGWLGWKQPASVVVVNATCMHCAGSLPAVAGEALACPLCGGALVVPEGAAVPIARDTVLKITGAQLSLASLLLVLDVFVLLLYSLHLLR